MKIGAMIRPRDVSKNEWRKVLSLEYAKHSIAPKKPKAPKFAHLAVTRYQKYLQSAHWKVFKLTVLAERGAICEVCRRHKRVDLHHTSYARLGREIPSDVKVLCRMCHASEHGLIEIKSQARD